MLRGVRGDIVGDDDLVGHILRVLQDGHQAGVGVVDLVVDRDHDGHRGILHLVKMKPPVGQIVLADLKIPVNQISSLRRGV